MTTLKFITTFLLIALYSCGQKPAKHKADPAAVELNNKAMTLVAFIDNSDSSKKAISLLDKATTIDSNYFLGYYNKLMFFNQLKQFDKAILTVNKLIQLRPSAHDLYMTGGILYEQIGDTISSKTYFEKSLTICNNVLDTMSNKNRDYEMLVSNKAINLIMLGQQEDANKILKALYDTRPDDPEYDNVTKKWIQSLMNKNKAELMDTFINPDKYSH
jgi:tetratricopeptide (TPR) repeat protein